MTSCSREDIYRGTMSTSLKELLKDFTATLEQAAMSEGGEAAKAVGEKAHDILARQRAGRRDCGECRQRQDRRLREPRAPRIHDPQAAAARHRHRRGGGLSVGLAAPALTAGRPEAVMLLLTVARSAAMVGAASALEAAGRLRIRRLFGGSADDGKASRDENFTIGHARTAKYFSDSRTLLLRRDRVDVEGRDGLGIRPLLDGVRQEREVAALDAPPPKLGHLPAINPI